MAARMTVTGVEAMSRKLSTMARSFGDRVGRVLYRRAELVMTRSKESFVPVDLGPLRDSGHVQAPVRLGRVVSVTLAFGGPSAPYALAVHEHLSEHSPPSWKAAERAGRPVSFSPAGRGPKYLERPLLEWMATAAADLAVDLSLEGGVR